MNIREQTKHISNMLYEHKNLVFMRIRVLTDRTGITKPQFMEWDKYQKLLANRDNLIFISKLTQENYYNTMDRIKRGLNPFLSKLKDELNEVKKGFIFINDKRLF